jgi:hypothetical protein
MTVPYGPGPAGANNVLNISVATVVKATEGVLTSLSVVTAGSAAGGVYDAATTGGATAANQIGAIAQTVTAQPLVFNWRCLTGILVVPPTGGVVAVSFV